VYPPTQIFAKLVTKNTIKHQKGVPSAQNFHNPYIPSLPIRQKPYGPSRDFQNVCIYIMFPLYLVLSTSWATRRCSGFLLSALSLFLYLSLSLSIYLSKSLFPIASCNSMSNDYFSYFYLAALFYLATLPPEA
jgi:hypothetical protein